MKITTKPGLVGLILALSTLQIATTQAEVSASENPVDLSIESRLLRVTNALQQRETFVEKSPLSSGEKLAGWADGRGGRGWADTARGGGWADTARGGGWADAARGGGWVDGGGWRNGWADGGRFVNYR